MSEAGGSAQREYERRRARERAAVKANLVWTVPFVLVVATVAGLLAERYIGSMGWIAFAVTGACLGLQFWGTSSHILAYAKGAEGERRTNRSLQKLPDYTVLHDRKIPGSKANIDHIAVGPGGVFVIETKHYEGRVTVTGDDLLVNGRRRTRIVEQTWREAVAVQGALAPELSRLGLDVTPILCIHGVELPWSRTTVQGVRVCGARELRNLMAKSDARLTPDDIDRLVKLVEVTLQGS